MNFIIRQLALDEIPKIGQIDNSDVVDARYVCIPNTEGLGLSLQRVVVEPPEHEPNWGEEELSCRYALWRRNVEEEGAVFFGAFVGDALAGVSLMTKFPDGQTAELYALHVDRQHRRQGLGAALMERVENQCAAWDCAQLLTYTTLKASSLDFYRSRKFCVIGLQDPSVETKNFEVTLLKKLKQD
ncbi:MAG TPA: GNAT family N-acetyltransferase [Candidatus Hydrogenedentes bacterium]|nr:GNAT family N-acetyltransferase [Candidatus Hydrogenedentota bacterium]HIJ74354.1 GNAT family N-acetyltransferase [Candidatus Hydrogenedentota bacterium]